MADPAIPHAEHASGYPSWPHACCASRSGGVGSGAVAGKARGAGGADSAAHAGAARWSEAGRWSRAAGRGGPCESAEAGGLCEDS